MDFKDFLIMLFVPMMLVACASNQTIKPEIEEIFVTDIKPNGIKFFSYTVTESRSSGSRSGAGGGKEERVAGLRIGARGSGTGTGTGRFKAG